MLSVKQGCIKYLFLSLWFDSTSDWTPISEPLAIGLMSRVFANGPEDQGSIPGRVIPKTQKMVLDATLLNTQYYKVRIKGGQSGAIQGKKKRPPLHLGVVAIEKGVLQVTLD